MKYYLRLTDSDKFVNGGVYSEEFLKQINGDYCPTVDNWKVLKSNVAIELNGTNEQYIQARNLLIEICGEDYEFDNPLPNYNYLTIGSFGGILLMNRVEGLDIITLPINQIKQCDNLDVTQEYDPEILVLPPIEMSKSQWDEINNRPNHSTLGSTPINWDGVKDIKEWDYKLTQKTITACELLNLTYIDGKILESLTNKDYTKIIELCKNQLNN